MNTDPLFQTPICRRLDIQYPIFQAGMGYVAHAELAAAVSNAGGLGCIGSGSMGSRELREQIRRCRALTDRSFGADILFAEVKADPANSEVTRYTNNVQRCVDVTFEEKVPVIDSIETCTEIVRAVMEEAGRVLHERVNGAPPRGVA